MSLPWARPRREALLLVLVALAVLSPVHISSTQDVSRLCLTRALLHGHLTIEPCAGDTTDRARYGGRVYSDKAPGVSILALPSVAAVRLPPARPGRHWRVFGDPRVWVVRLFTGGIAFVLLAFAVGRAAEGLRAGTGAPTLVAFSLGTLVAPLAATTFDAVPAAACAFAAFLLAWRGSYALAGLAAGAAVLVEYQAALAAIVVAAYVVARGARPLARYAAGAVPPLALLAAYDWAAFGSPFHLSYHYVANAYARDQSSGVFGIHAPRAHAAHLVFLGDRGLLIVSPVLVAAAAGLVLLARTHRREAVACAAVTIVFVLLNVGYFLPYGGVSPGARFLVPALPFLALGLAPAFARWRLPTLVLAALSVLATVAVTLTWAATGSRTYRGTIWGELTRHDSRIPRALAKNVVVWAGADRTVAADLVALSAVAAFAAATLAGRGGETRGATSRSRRY